MEMGGVGPWAIGPTVVDLDPSVVASILCCAFILSHVLKVVLGSGKRKSMKEKVETLQLQSFTVMLLSLSTNSI